MVTEKGRIYPVTDLNVSVSLNEGGIDREKLLEANHDGIIKTTTGHELLFCEPSFKDRYNWMKKGAAVIIPKDIGFIIAETGLTKESVVLEAGSGAGGLTCQLAALCKKVYSFDINEVHLKTVRENCSRLELSNVDIRKEDIYNVESDLPSNVDLVVLDVPEPTKAIKTVKKALKQGGFVVFYTPHINQAQDVVLSLDSDFKFLTTIELIQRRWEVDDKRLRPKHAMLGHTAFLTVARKFERVKN